MTPKYAMKISRLIVDKLGVKLYDKVSAVIAELVANSYDADATEVIVSAPMGEFLASKAGNTVKDKGFEIIVTDDGIGMTPEEVNNFYLLVGSERRRDARGDKSRKYGRSVMGRKGVGKLAPFGICNKVEVWTSGGDKIKGKDENGNIIEGYMTAHIILDGHKIMSASREDYEPEVGELDGLVDPNHGTFIRLSEFYYRKVPALNDFSRQLAQRFGIRQDNWKIFLTDNTKTESDDEYEVEVGDFDVDTMPNTMIRFNEPNPTTVPPKASVHVVIGPDGEPIPDLHAGFELESTFYPIRGWMAYAKSPYKDELMAGVRIYCRGKIASQTAAFDMKAGFTGEHSIRSYLVGELHADWLDEDEDLIQTDRRDLLWSHELGMAFQEWGQRIVRHIGTLSREPMRKKLSQQFMEASQAEKRVTDEYPGKERKALRQKALSFAKLLGERINAEEIQNPDAVNSMMDLALMIAPHVELDEKLRETASSSSTSLKFAVNLLKTAKVAELASYGRIAKDRVRVIEKLITLKDTPEADESVFQQLIEEAPWLINPQWSPITSNQSMATLKEEFSKYYEKETGTKIVLSDFSMPRKRPDFVLSSNGRQLQVIEIKRPGHALKDDEVVRIDNYISCMTKFLNMPEHKDFKSLFYDFHVTLVCDKLSLGRLAQNTFDLHQQNQVLDCIDWITFILRTRRAHESFLELANEERAHAVAE
jgi:hypothetical protein